MNRYIIYNPFAFLPIFKFEPNKKMVDEKGNELEYYEIELNSDESRVIYHQKSEMGVKKTNIDLKRRLFFYSFELIVSAIFLLWSLYLFFSTRTDILSVLIFLVGFSLSCFLVWKNKFAIANFIYAVTAIAVMINLAVYYKNAEIVFAHIGILGFAMFFVVSFLYRIVKKRNLLNQAQFWYELENKKGKAFFFINSENDEMIKEWEFTKLRKKRKNDDKK